MDKINVFYMPEQNAESQSFSPSAQKPSLVAKEMATSQYSASICWRKFKPLSIKTISLAHDLSYVTGVIEGSKENGFGNKYESVSKSLPYTTGSFTYAAIRTLMEKPALPSVSLTSGFHHACWNAGGGFCTFNGLMIASITLKKLNLLAKGGVGIIDFDMHYGNGTDDIIRKLGIHYVKHTGTRYMRWGLRGSDAIYEKDILAKLEYFKDCDILFYQAGADAHIDDPLGGLLTTAQMKARDRLVFNFAKDNNIPLVWNLAGGYQDPVAKVVQLHMNTLEECIAVYGDR